MLKLLLKINPYLLLITALAPGLIFYLYTPDNKLAQVFCYNFFALVYIFWIGAITEWINKESPSKKNLKLIVLFLIIYFLSYAIDQVFITSFDSFAHSFNDIVKYTRIGSGLAIAFLLTYWISSIFYERSQWFLFIEILTFFIGAITLTTEIKKYVKEQQNPTPTDK